MVALTQDTNVEIDYFQMMVELNKGKKRQKELADHIWMLFQHLDVQEPSADLLHSVCHLAAEFDLDHTVLGEELSIKVGELLNNPEYSYTSDYDCGAIAQWGMWRRN